MLNNPNASKAEKIQALKEWFAKTVIDPEVTQKTLGVAYSSITPRSLVTASVKLLNMNRGKAHADNRDALDFSTFLGIEDQVHEHIHKDSGGIQKNAAKKMEQKKT